MRYNILFVCKFNRLRSPFAEAYFNTNNTNPNVFARSAGIFQGEAIDDGIRESVRLYGVELKEKPETITMDLLQKQDMIVIVADDVPFSLFQDHRISCKNIIVWNIPDTKKSLPVITEEIQNLIQKLNQEIS